MTDKILIRGLYTGRYGLQSDSKHIVYRDNESIFEREIHGNLLRKWKVLEISNPEFFTYYDQYFHPKDSQSYIVIDDEEIKILLESDK